jgi:hypothetical protein
MLADYFYQQTLKLALMDANFLSVRASQHATKRHAGDFQCVEENIICDSRHSLKERGALYLFTFHLSIQLSKCLTMTLKQLQDGCAKLPCPPRMPF